MMQDIIIMHRTEMLNFPKIAYRNFQQLKHDFNFIKITKSLINRLKKHGDKKKRAKLAHKEVDYHLKNLFRDPAVKEQISCKKGCHACCHGQVSITSDEAILLGSRVLDGLDIDLELLYEQSLVKNSPANWFKLDFNRRRCLFLDDFGHCRIYEDRPIVCRTNFAISDPKHCSTEQTHENTVRILNTLNSDMATVGAFQASKENGAMPYMLYRALDKLLEEKSLKTKNKKSQNRQFNLHKN